MKAEPSAQRRAVITSKPTGLPSLEPYLAPARAVAAAASIDWLKATPPDVRYLQGKTLTNYDRTGLQRHLANCPPVAVLNDLVHALQHAIGVGVVPEATATAVALLFDSRARQPDNGRAYVAALTHDLCDMGFPSAAVVAACQELRRTSKWMPEIAEVIEACERTTKTYPACLSLARRIIERSSAIAELLLIDRQHCGYEPPTEASP